jgi:hypothetical protein
MAYFRISDALAAYEHYAQRQLVFKSADKILASEARTKPVTTTYEIFLSHAFEDAKLILGVKLLLEAEGRTVYVDWLDDEQLDRAKVTPATAALLRARMQASQSLLFATSKASPDSRWMPWELGYFDGLRPGKISILPLLGAYDTSFKGQEYLGLYPVVERLQTTGGEMKTGVVKRAPLVEKDQYAWLQDFTKGTTSFRTFS